MARSHWAPLLTLAVTLSQTYALGSPNEPTDAEIKQWIAEQTAEVSFLVIGSFSSDVSALRTVERVHRAAGLEVDLRGLRPVGGSLSLSREDCGEGYDYPCWYPRGRMGQETTLSIERSDWYPPMSPGFFIVVAANGNRDEIRPVKEVLARAGVRSYVRTVPVYMGCMH